VQNSYKSIVEGSGDRCRGGDWVGRYDNGGREGSGGRRLGAKRNGARTRIGRLMGGCWETGPDNRVVPGDCSNPSGSIFIGYASTVG
jgi:hypothetical protein